MIYSIKCCDGRFGALFICRSGKVATLSFLIISQPTTDFGVGVGKRGKGGWDGKEGKRKVTRSLSPLRLLSNQ